MDIFASEIVEEKKLLKVITEWQGCPEKYTATLLDHVYPTLLKICKEHEESSFNREYVKSSADSLVSEAFIKLRTIRPDSEINSLRVFYDLLRSTIRSILMDKYKKSTAKKRCSGGDSIVINYRMYETGRYKMPAYDLLEFDLGLVKLKDIEPAAAEALSLRFYNAKTNAQTAFIMNKSLATVERLMTEGMKMLHAIMGGVELSHNA